MTLRWAATSLWYWPLVPVPWVYLSTSRSWHPGRPAEPAGRPALFSVSPAHRAELLFLPPQLPSLLQAPEAEPVQSNKKYHEQHTHAILSLLTLPPPPPPPTHTLSLWKTQIKNKFSSERSKTVAVEWNWHWHSRTWRGQPRSNSALLVKWRSVNLVTASVLLSATMGCTYHSLQNFNSHSPRRHQGASLTLSHSLPHVHCFFMPAKELVKNIYI